MRYVKEMTKQMITKASPAKINLYLRVLRRREDGYHDILSLMQRISLCDEMTFAPGAKRHCRSAVPTARCPRTRDNIVYRAAAAFFSRIAAPPGVEITIRKRIPIAAGLGGGSSNAATTLMTLNEISGIPSTREELLGIGTQLGGGCPLFHFRQDGLGLRDRRSAHRGRLPFPPSGLS